WNAAAARTSFDVSDVIESLSAVCWHVWTSTLAPSRVLWLACIPETFEDGLVPRLSADASAAAIDSSYATVSPLWKSSILSGSSFTSAKTLVKRHDNLSPLPSVVASATAAPFAIALYSQNSCPRSGAVTAGTSAHSQRRTPAVRSALRTASCATRS